MKREIVLSSKAKIQITNLLNFIEGKWNKKTKEKLAHELNRVLKIIVENPEIFPISTTNKKVRKAVITKQNSLFYHFNYKHIVILSIFDTRQDPNKIKKDIK